MALHMSILMFVLIFDSIKLCSNLTKPNRWLELVMRYLIFFYNIHNHHKIRFDTQKFKNNTTNMHVSEKPI